MERPELSPTHEIKYMIEDDRDCLLFDGDCGICSYLSEVAGRMKGGRQFVIWPYQSIPEAELERYGIGYADCEQKLQVITGNGKVHAGAFAVNYFLWQRFPWNLAVLLVYLLPILLVFEIIGYRLVAANRHRISGWFGLKACLIKQSS